MTETERFLSWTRKWHQMDCGAARSGCPEIIFNIRIWQKQKGICYMVLVHILSRPRFLIFWILILNKQTEAKKTAVGRNPLKSLSKWTIPRYGPRQRQRRGGADHSTHVRNAKCVPNAPHGNHWKTIGKRCVSSGHHRCTGLTQTWTVFQRIACAHVWNVQNDIEFGPQSDCTWCDMPLTLRTVVI